MRFWVNFGKFLLDRFGSSVLKLEHGVLRIRAKRRFRLEDRGYRHTEEKASSN